MGCMQCRQQPFVGCWQVAYSALAPAPPSGACTCMPGAPLRGVNKAQRNPATSSALHMCASHGSAPAPPCSLQALPCSAPPRAYPAAQLPLRVPAPAAGLHRQPPLLPRPDCACLHPNHIMHGTNMRLDPARVCCPIALHATSPVPTGACPALGCHARSCSAATQPCSSMPTAAPRPCT